MKRKVDIMRKIAVASFSLSVACLLALIVAGLVACTTAQVQTGLQVGAAICDAIQILGPPVGAYTSTVGDKSLPGGGPAKTWTLVFADGTVIESTDGRSVSGVTPPGAP